MKCAEIEVLLCDYLDGVLAPAERGRVEAHLAACADCGELAKDAAAAVVYLDQVEPVEAPPELLTRILFHAPTGAEALKLANPDKLGWFRRWFEPILQPRFAMGLAMTILSFSMVGRIVGFQPRQLTIDDVNPVKVWGSLDDKLHRTYSRAMKYYENLRLVYEIQSRLREWSAQEEEDRRMNGTAIQPASATPDAGSSNVGREKQ